MRFSEPFERQHELILSRQYPEPVVMLELSRSLGNAAFHLTHSQ